MILGAEERSRLTAAARAIPSEGSEQDGFTKGTDVLSAEPRAVFAQSLQALRARAVIAEQLSDEELVEFQQQLGRTYSEIMWLRTGWAASTRANANRTTGLPNSYAGSAPRRSARYLREGQVSWQMRRGA